MFTTLALAATACATAITFTLRLVPMAVMLRFHWLFDVLFTALAFVIFAGTLGGTLVATLAGLMFTLFLSGSRGIARLRERIARLA